MGWHFGADPDPPDPYFWLMDPVSDPAPDPAPDSTPFLIDFKDAKFFFSYFFLKTCPLSDNI